MSVGGGGGVGWRGVSSSFPSQLIAETQAASLGKPPVTWASWLLSSHSVSGPGSGLPPRSGSPASLDPQAPEQRLHQHSQPQQHVSPTQTVALVPLH